MESAKKKKRVTLKKKHQNQHIKRLLQDLYSRVVKKDHRTAQKIEQAVGSLSKYPLPLSSGEDCFILKGFDKSLCRYVNEKLFITELESVRTNDEYNPVPETNTVLSTENNNNADKDIQTDKTIEDQMITGNMMCGCII